MQIAVSGMAAGAIDTIGPSLGQHTVTLRASGVSSSQSITTAAGALNTVAVVRSSTGAVGSAILDDTNSVVPAGATVLRMMSASPAWKPQAILTDVASSIMAASLPISQAPNPSPKSQLRSMVVMLVFPCASR